MITTKLKRQVKVSPRTMQEVQYVERTGLFGIIKWWEKEKITNIGNELCIYIENPPKQIYINGKLINLDIKEE